MTGTNIRHVDKTEVGDVYYLTHPPLPSFSGLALPLKSRVISAQQKILAKSVAEGMCFDQFINSLQLSRFRHRLDALLGVPTPPREWLDYSLGELKVSKEVEHLSVNTQYAEAFIPLLEVINSRFCDGNASIRQKLVREDSNDGSYYVYIDPTEIVPALAQLANFLDDETLPFLFRAIVAHAIIVAVHPFEDGNGRTARVFMNVYLRKYISYFYFPLREIQWTITPFYYIIMRKAVILNEWEDLVRFFCTIFERGPRFKGLIIKHDSP